MILGTSQARRFIKLFNLLMDHMAQTQEGRAALEGIVGSFEEVDALVADAMMSLLWGPEGGTALLQAYVEDNPDGLSRTDLREVVSWRDGIYGTFPTVRLGNDVVCVFGDYALAVRGIRREIDTQVTLPDAVRTVLVPFDGLITYGTALAVGRMPTREEQRSHVALAQDVVARRGLVRSARQLAKVLPDARAHAADMAADMVGETAAKTAGATGVVKDVEKRQAGSSTRPVAGEGAVTGASLHRGALAGLTWDERKRVLDEHFAERQAAAFRAQAWSSVDKACSKGAPATSILGACRRLSKRELMKIARSNREEFGSDGSGKSREQLAQALSEFLVAHGTELADHEVHMGEASTRSLRRLVEAGGTLTVPAGGDEVYDMPTQFVPMVCYHRAPDGYLVWLAPEIYAQLVDLDWDARVAEAHILDEAVDKIRRSIELRGVVAREEALDSVASIVDRDLVAEVIKTRMIEKYASFTEESIDGKRYFAHLRFEHAAEIERGGGSELGSRERYIRQIIELQGPHIPRDVSVLDGFDSVLSLVESYPTYRNLVAFLDEHVPKGEDEYSYAHLIANEIVDCSQYFFGEGTIMDHFDFEVDIAADEAEFARFVDLADALMKDVPRWSLNGWSYREDALTRGRR